MRFATLTLLSATAAVFATTAASGQVVVDMPAPARPPISVLEPLETPDPGPTALHRYVWERERPALDQPPGPWVARSYSHNRAVFFGRPVFIPIGPVVKHVHHRPPDVERIRRFDRFDRFDRVPGEVMMRRTPVR